MESTACPFFVKNHLKEEVNADVDGANRPVARRAGEFAKAARLLSQLLIS
jgi:hypothetical protein